VNGACALRDKSYITKFANKHAARFCTSGPATWTWACSIRSCAMSSSVMSPADELDELLVVGGLLGSAPIIYSRAVRWIAYK